MSSVGSSAQLRAKSATSSHPCWARVKWDRPGEGDDGCALIGLAMTGHDGAEPGWSARLHDAAAQALADLAGTVEPLRGRLAGLDRRRLRAVMGAGAFEAVDAAATPSTRRGSWLGSGPRTQQQASRAWLTKVRPRRS
jgi:hypothetical protein